MRKSNQIYVLAVSALIISGCSTKPRNFSAIVLTPANERVAFENDYRTCQTLVRSGHSSEFRAAAATALATGVGTVGATVGAAGVGAVGMAGATTAASIAIPFIGVLAGFGVSRAIRGGKERKFKRLMSSCLTEYGYSVDSWVKLGKREDSVLAASRNVIVAVPMAEDQADASTTALPPVTAIIPETIVPQY